ncbi:DUF4179 domain-containing protein [Dysosmobacter sp.]
MNELFEYTTALDGLRFTPEQKTRLAARAAAGAAPCRHSRRSLGRAALIAACLAAALMVGAGAAGVLKPAVDVFAPLFGGSAAQTEIIDKIGYPVGASDTDNGVTVTADAIMGDQYNACIVFTFSRDDGQALLPAGANAKNLLAGGVGGADMNVRGGSHGSSWFVDEDPADSTLQMVQVISSDVPLIGCTATARFHGLFGWDDAAGQSVPLVEGEWAFKFSVNYEDSSVTLGGGETFTQDGICFTINAITLSPVACRVDYTADSAVVWSDAPSGRQSDADRREMERYLENVEILLTRTDGTVLDLSSAGGSISPEGEHTGCVKSLVLDEIVPLDEVESICVGGIVYPLSAS